MIMIRKHTASSHSGSGSDSDYQGPPKSKHRKLDDPVEQVADDDTKGKGKARERSKSLTPPPELDRQKLQQIELIVRFVLALVVSIWGSLFDQLRIRPQLTELLPSYHSRLTRRNAAAEIENPLVGAAPEQEAQARSRRENSYNPDREKIKITVRMKFHQLPTSSNANAIKHFEKPRIIQVFRVSVPFLLLASTRRRCTSADWWCSCCTLSQSDPLDLLFGAVAKKVGYPVENLVLTLDGNRVYKSTSPETLGIHDGVEMGS